MATHSPARGPKWVVLSRANSSIVSDTINALAQDRDGGVWVGTDNGAGKYWQGSWSNYQSDLQYSVYSAGGRAISRKVNAISLDLDGTVWFGTAGGGIFRLNSRGLGVIWTNYAPPTLLSPVTLSIAADIQANMWVGTSQGAEEFIASPTTGDPIGGSWKDLTKGGLIPSEPVYCVAFNGNDNTIGFGTFNQGLILYDADLDWSICLPRDQPFPFLALAFDVKDIAWLGTLGDGAYEYNVSSNEWAHYVDTSYGGPLFSGNVLAVAPDYRGVEWIGTDKGLMKFDGSIWRSFTQANSPIPDSLIRALLIDANGNLWIGTTQGVAVYNENGTIL